LGFFFPTVTVAAHVLVVIVISVRVIMTRPATGVALAWLFLVAMLPFAGAIVYFLIGERRIGVQRERAINVLRTDYKAISILETVDNLTEVDWSRHSPTALGMDILGRTMAASPTVRGSNLQLLGDTQEILHAIARDVEGAQHSVLMEFYIWQQGGAADEVMASVIRAAERGVSCRLLVDAVGARPWWRSRQPRRLLEAGVMLKPALPFGFFRTMVGRTDLRLHRKIVIIDGQVAWTGSMNLVDPRFFKQDVGVGQWVDAMVRVRGTAVSVLGFTMIGDWVIESNESAHDVVKSAGLHLVSPYGNADVQVIPSGPGETSDSLLQMLLALINAAEKELVLTTPYLVPDESMVRALRGAAGRGVKVSVIVPERVDSLLTRFASRSYYDNLLDMGAAIYLYRRGLLHTKSITADGRMSMFGTVNLDMRSLWLNYEVALFVYDRDFGAQLRALQQSYVEASDRLEPAVWRGRSAGLRLIENTLRLASPLL